MVPVGVGGGKDRNVWALKILKWFWVPWEWSLLKNARINNAQVYEHQATSDPGSAIASNFHATFEFTL
jgi:hypothetical protein